MECYLSRLFSVWHVIATTASFINVESFDGLV